jgi:DNA repair protein RadC
MIKTLPLEENPREKAMNYGIETLSNVELLALIIRTGNKSENVLQLAQRILKEAGGIQHLTELNYALLTSIKGIKKAKAIELLSVIELTKRIQSQPLEKLCLNNPEKIYNYMKNKMMFLNQEHFVVLCLDVKCQLIKEKTLFIGTINMSIIDEREIIKEALLTNSVALVLCHNHPSGDSTPSDPDLMITKQIVNAAKMMNIEILDHIIIGKNEYYSIIGDVKIYDR